MWATLGNVAVTRLIEPRIQLHYAINVLMAAGRAFAPREPDFGHASFQWLAGSGDARLGPGVLAGRRIEGAHPFRVALRLDRPAFALLDPDDPASGPMTQLDLAGRTLAAATDWLRERVRERDLDPSAMVVKLPVDMPDHPVAHGRAFDFPDLDAGSELAAWYADADALIRGVSAIGPQATPVRCWPHHFDLASLIKLTNREGDEAPCVGVGFSPGDQVLPEPYLYASPWPYPSVDGLPPAPSGAHWRTMDWVGVYLTASDLGVGVRPEEQERRARTFLREGLATSISLLQHARARP
jgi:hypothetical protein